MSLNMQNKPQSNWYFVKSVGNMQTQCLQYDLRRQKIFIKSEELGKGCYFDN